MKSNDTLLVVGALASGWLTWFFAWPLGLALALPLIAAACMKGRKPAAVSVGLSPFIAVPVAAFFAGLVAWAGGRAQIHQPGLAHVESGNLHSKYRVPQVVSGFGNGSRDAMYRRPYNAAVRTLGTVFGPMPGSYRGAYPAQAAAWTRLDTQGQAALFDRDKVWVGYRQTPQRLTALDEALSPWAAELRAVYQDGTLIIGHPNQLWLVDSKSGRAFATYRRKDLVFSWPGAARPR